MGVDPGLKIGEKVNLQKYEKYFSVEVWVECCQSIVPM